MSNIRHTRIGSHHAPDGRFTGRSGSKSKKQQKSTRKQRRLKRYTHQNKYADLGD